jgi:hypothetical protein
MHILIEHTIMENKEWMSLFGDPNRSLNRCTNK